MSTIKTNQLAHTANGAATYTLPQTDGSAGQVLKTDGSGNLSWVSLPAATDPGLAMADLWRLTSNQTMTYNAYNYLTAWERVDTDGFGQLGTGMTHSSGEFTFPSTGIYWIQFIDRYPSYAWNTGNWFHFIQTTTSGSFSAPSAESDFASRNKVVSNIMFDVTNTTTHKLRVAFYQINSHPNNTGLKGDTNINQTHMTFLKLGAT